MSAGIVTPNYTSTGAGVTDIIYCDEEPDAGTDAIQILTIGGTPDGGTFRLGYGSIATADIEWTATDADLIDNIQDALDALYTLGTDWVVATDDTLTDGIGDVDLTFSGGDVQKRLVGLITIEANNLTGSDPTLEVNEDTAGADATGRDAAPGSVMVDFTNTKKYIQTGDEGDPPTWTLVGSQS